MRKPRILWVDDEIDLLRPHIIFLQEKSYEVETANNGSDAIDKVKENFYDIIFLDENMPGMTGLETLTEIKSVSPNVPVVMITKSEEENIMDEAIGSKIADYLIKPVNPKQILLSLKKNTDQKRLVTQQTTCSFRRLGCGLTTGLLTRSGLIFTKNWFTGKLNLAARKTRPWTRLLPCKRKMPTKHFLSS